MKLHLCTQCGASVSSLAGTLGSDETTDNPQGLATEHSPTCQIGMMLLRKRPPAAPAPPTPGAAPIGPPKPPPADAPKVPPQFPADWPLPPGWVR